MVALGALFTASACSVVGSAGAITAERLSAQLAPIAEDFRSAWQSASAQVSTGLARDAKTGRSSGGPATEVHPVGAGLETIEARAAQSDAPRATTVRLKPRPRPGAFSMNLYERGDFVHQATEHWCVSASVQTMMNIIDDGRPNRSRKFQRRLHFQGRELDNDRDDDDDDDRWAGRRNTREYRLGLHGLGLTDWRDLLNKHGYGPYRLERAPTRKNAIRKAAKALRMTGRPVGLVVWRGAHAWVMSGFTATGDPAYTNDFKVKSVFIQDVWYPYVSSIWGPSPPPNANVPVAALGQDYLRYDRPGRRHPMRDGKFMMILPRLPRDTRVR